MAMTGATVGKFGIVSCSNEQVPVLNQRVALFEPLNGANGGFVISALLGTNIYEQVVTRAGGSAQPNISADDIMESKLIVPTDVAIECFEEIVSPLFHLWNANKKESQSLACTRNLLLPRLLSGDLKLDIVQIESEAK